MWKKLLLFAYFVPFFFFFYFNNISAFCWMSNTHYRWNQQTDHLYYHKILQPIFLLKQINLMTSTPENYCAILKQEKAGLIWGAEIVDTLVSNIRSKYYNFELLDWNEILFFPKSKNKLMNNDAMWVTLVPMSTTMVVTTILVVVIKMILLSKRQLLQICH